MSEDARCAGNAREAAQPAVIDRARLTANHIGLACIATALALSAISVAVV